MVRPETLTIRTEGRGSIDISNQVNKCVSSSGIARNLCDVFIQHTSTSLMLCENADVTVRSDLERFMEKLVPDGDKMFRHTAEGDDDMPAHIRTILTDSHLTIPVSAGQCVLGTWQGIYLWEHGYQSHTRKVTVTVYGE